MKKRYYYYKPDKYCGLLILSKFKILHTYFELFNDSNFPDNLTNKGFGSITINVCDNNINNLIDIFFTHTQSVYNDNDCSNTIKNILQMKRKIDMTKNKKIICGDLNMSLDKIKYIFPNLSCSNLDLSSKNDNYLFQKFQNDNKSTKLDYILYDNNFKLLESCCGNSIVIDKIKIDFKIDYLDLSDHYPIYSELYII